MSTKTPDEIRQDQIAYGRDINNRKVIIPEKRIQYVAKKGQAADYLYQALLDIKTAIESEATDVVWFSNGCTVCDHIDYVLAEFKRRVNE